MGNIWCRSPDGSDREGLLRPSSKIRPDDDDDDEDSPPAMTKNHS